MTDVFHASDLQVVLKDSIAGNSLALLLIIDATKTRLRLLTREISQDCLVSLSIILLEHNEFVRNDAHLLQSNSLGLRPGESLDDPALLASLHLLDLLFDQLDNDLVSDIAVGGQ